MNVVTVVFICLGLLSVTMVLDGFTVKNGISRWLAGLTLFACAACTAADSVAIGTAFRTGGMTVLVLLSFIWLNISRFRYAMALRYGAVTVFSFFLYFVSLLALDARYDRIIEVVMIVLGAAYCALLSAGPADAFFLALYCIVFTDVAEGIWECIANGYLYFDVGSAARSVSACLCALPAFILRDGALRLGRMRRRRAARRMGAVVP